MTRKTMNRFSLLVLALGLASTAMASPQGIRNVNVCRGMGHTCYCSGACVAGHDGCRCL
jgi:hypothetical protein